MTNEFGIELDSNGYAPSILQEDLTYCIWCGRRDRKLDRHEPFNAALRKKSKKYGLWVMLCHEDCHQGPHGVHSDAKKANKLRYYAQKTACEHYGWTPEEWRERFYRSYV